MAITSQAIVDSMLTSIDTSRRLESPYRHWILRQCLPSDVVDTVLGLLDAEAVDLQCDAQHLACTFVIVDDQHPAKPAMRPLWDSVRRGWFSLDHCAT